MATVTAFDQRNRNAGTYTSNSFAVPAGVREITVFLILPNADLADVTLTVRGAYEFSADVSANVWQPAGSAVWQGGAIDPDTGQPYVPSFGTSVPPGALWVRGVLDIPRRLNVGLTVVTEP